MNRLNYLLQAEPMDIKLTWAAGGAIKVNNDTLIYNANTIYLIDSPIVLPDNEQYAELAQALIYCTNNYVVDGEADDENANYPRIRWTAEENENGELEAASEAINLDGFVSVYEGVALPHFRILLDGETCQNLGEINKSQLKTFKPFKDNIATSEIQIDDDELKIILGETGVPFLDISELEFSKDDILNICIKPALQTYYSYFPIVKNDSDIGAFSSNTNFKIQMPKYAFNANAFFTQGSYSMNGSGYMSPFAFFSSEILGGGAPTTASPYFKGSLSYIKPVPGFSGRENGGKNAMLDQMAARQALQNKFKRERIQRIKENGKLYITGYSTTSGTLNVQWLMWSPDWEMVDFEHLAEVRDLCKSYVLRNLGMLRSLIKSDLPSSIDFSLYTNRADSLKEAVIKRWAGSSEMLKWTPARGGL